MSKDAKKLSVEVDEIRKEFCHNMVKNIEDRFQKEAVDVAMAFHILGMRPLTHLSKSKGKNTEARNWRKEEGHGFFTSLVLSYVLANTPME